MTDDAIDDNIFIPDTPPHKISLLCYFLFLDTGSLFHCSCLINSLNKIFLHLPPFSFILVHGDCTIKRFSSRRFNSATGN